MNNNEFDLLLDSWIPCLQIEGFPSYYSIRSSLENAGRIKSIEHESPIVRVAVLRLLLAFCYRVAYVNGVPLCSFRNWKSLKGQWKEGIPSKWIDNYLDVSNCRDKFRLFDDKYPFFQIAGLKCEGKSQPEAASRLIFEQFAGTPNLLWEHLQEAPSLQEAALYLITCQAFGASSSNTSNAVIGDLEYEPTGRTFAPTYTGCIVWMEADNLLETIMLNLVDYDLTDTDLPVWEKPLKANILRARQPQKTKEGKKIGDYRSATITGPVQLFTWPSRAVLLGKPKNGQVETVHFTQGLALSDQPVDQMKPYNQEGKPVKLQRHKVAWRDLYSILAIQPNHNRTVQALSLAVRSGLKTARINIAGIARGDEAAKILFWRHERMPIRTVLLSNVTFIERLGELLQNAEQTAFELNRRTRRIAKLFLAPDSESIDGRKADKKEIAKLTDAIDPRPAYWARMEEHFFDLLENLTNDWNIKTDDWELDAEQNATKTWRNQVKKEAQQALEESIRSLGTTARAIQAIARVRTDFNDNDLKPMPQKDTRTKRKEAGNNEP